MNLFLIINVPIYSNLSLQIQISLGFLSMRPLFICESLPIARYLLTIPKNKHTHAHARTHVGTIVVQRPSNHHHHQTSDLSDTDPTPIFYPP